MNLRKLLAILLALLVVLSFAACDGGGGGSSSDNGGTNNGGNGGGGETTVPAPLCFTAVDGKVKVGITIPILKEYSIFTLPALEWSSDGETYEKLTINIPEPEPTSGLQLRAPAPLPVYDIPIIEELPSGSKLYVRAAGTNKSFSDGKWAISFYFDGDGKVEASGNIMSLLDKTRALTEIPSKHCFAGMFAGCTALTKAPELPATTLAEGCYMNMFGYCTALTKAPELPATELVPGCYAAMFEGCTSLNSITVSFTSWGNDDDDCTAGWVYEVAKKGNFECPVDLYNEALKMGPGPDTIPAGWTVNGNPAEWE